MTEATKWRAFSQPGKRASFNLFPDLCKGCGLCMQKCPVKIIIWSQDLGVYGTPAVETSDQDKCIACKMCENVCPDAAIRIIVNPQDKDKE
ncbi:MAG: 4Fe-4S binding protein [Firmicutes bacterium]|nr:4Fe-4S binding protein [Bacillota bacterium]HOB34811.1 4Fe-4S binding protein [Bacillota bacterium]HPZ91059.1 4Fe-4S binding protein [Bacillota bacterium]HQE02088.1 4Fe-4S binding protein [Bacillota bacterium]